MTQEYSSFIIDAAEIISYAADKKCADGAKAFLSQYNIGTQDGSFSQSLVQKGFAKIKDGKIVLEPVIKFIFENLCSAGYSIKVKEKYVLVCPDAVMVAKKKPAVIDKLSIAVFKDLQQAESFLGILCRDEKVAVNGQKTDITFKEYIDSIAERSR